MTVSADSRIFDPHAYRRDFPILSRLVHGNVPLAYLDNAASTQRPRQVIQAIVEAYEEHYANVHRGVHTLAEEATGLFEGAREKVRVLIGAERPEEIVFTSGATSAVNLVARSWGDAHVRRHDEILVTEMEHHANLVPWHQLASRTGAKIRFIPVTDDGLLALDQLDGLINQRTRLVAVTAVSNVLGTINPLEEIIARAHCAGALVLVDGAQSVPHQRTDVRAMDADFFVFSGHKMMGPTGIGVLYAKHELLAGMPPFLGGGSMIKRVWIDGFEPGGVGDAADPRPTRFEAGTPPIVEAIALGAAVDYLSAVGPDAIHRHERVLTERAHELLTEVPGVRILGPAPDRKAGIVSFVFDTPGPHAHDVAQIVDQRGIAIRPGHHCAMPLHARFGVPASARASFYFYNTIEEVERLAAAVAECKSILQPSRAGSGRRRRSRRQEPTEAPVTEAPVGSSLKQT